MASFDYATVVETLANAGIDTTSITVGRYTDVLETVLPQYAGVLEAAGQDYNLLVKLHVCHKLALPLIGSGVNGNSGVVSASAGNVSVTYGGAYTPGNHWEATEWGLELRSLRTAQGPFTASGKGPALKFR